MEKKYVDIINEGKKQGAPVEAINAELKAAGANFRLNPDGGVDGWTEAEMAEGFIPAGRIGRMACMRPPATASPPVFPRRHPAAESTAPQSP